MILVPCTLALLQTSSKQDLTITFNGFTSSATGVQGADFIVSNVAERVVLVTENGFVQLKKRGEWIETGSTRSRVIGLQPGEAFIVNVVKPTNCETWRVFLTSGRARGPLRRQLGDFYEGQPLRFKPVSYLLLAPVLRQTFVYSEEIHN